MADSVSIPLVTQDKDLEAQGEGLPTPENRSAKGLSLTSKERIVFYATRFFCLLALVFLLALFVGFNMALWHFYVWLFTTEMDYFNKILFCGVGAIPVGLYLRAIIVGLEEWETKIEEEKRRKQEGTIEAV